MTIPQRLPALLTAAALLISAAACPFPQIVPAQSVRTAGPVQLHTEHHTDQLFSTLCLDAKTGRLLRDGADTGTEFAGFSAENGELRVQRAAVLTQAEAESGADSTGTVSAVEAAERIGCVVTETGQGTELCSPFQSGTLIVRADGALDAHGGTEVNCTPDGLRVLQYPTPADAYAAYNAFSADSSVSLAEPELVYHICAEGNPEDNERMLSNGMWGYDAVGCDAFMHRLDAEKNEPDPICVAVLDTGIFAEHDWFRGRIAEGGCSFVPDTDTDDDNWHGTHCAGILARCTRENVRILPIKVLDENGCGTSLQIYNAMLYAAEQGADLVSMSLGGNGLSLLLQEAAQKLKEQGIPCIAAAGNNKRDVKYENPANISSVIAVSAATDTYQLQSDGAFSEMLLSLMQDIPEKRYQKADFSNSGSGIDFSAPGAEITSAYLYETDALHTDSGTSMATPFVTACYANLMDYDRSLTPQQIYGILQANAYDLGEPGFDQDFGWGMVNLHDLIITDPDCPRPEIIPDESYNPMVPVTNLFTVTMKASSPKAEIIYTVNGSIPTRTNGIRYDGTPVQITHDMDLKAVCLYGDRSSAVTEKKYRFSISMPSAVNATPGLYYHPFQLELTGPQNSTVYYTLDGTDPDPETSIRYQGEQINISDTTVLSAIAVIGKAQSMIYRAVYEINNTDRGGLLMLSGTVLEHCYANDKELDLEKLAGDRVITEIAPNAFENNDIIRHIRLPKSVTAIGASAFAHCHALEGITATGVISVGDAAFKDCTKLKSYAFGTLASIGAESFRGCKQLEIVSGWDEDYTQLKSIGDYAFAETGLNARFELPALRTLGEFAFAETGNLELILPDTFTALPRGLCRHTGALKLTAEGVTKIGAMALEQETSQNTITELHIPWDSVTEIGAKALAHVNLNPVTNGRVVFSSLTSVGRGAFSSVACRGMAFPALKVIPQDAFDNIKTEVLRFEVAEAIRKNAINPNEALPCCVIFSDALTAIGSQAFGKQERFCKIAAPPGSKAAVYCLKNGYPMPESRAEMYIEQKELNCEQNTSARLTAIPLGIGLNVTWQDSDTVSDPPLTGGDMLLSDLNVPTDRLGTFTRYAVLRQNGKAVGTPQGVTVNVFRSRSFGEITDTDQPLLLCWEDVLSPQELAASAGSLRQAKCTFTAPNDGQYACFTDSAAAELRIRQNDKAEITQSGSGERPSGISYVTLKAGETVTLTVSSRQTDRTAAVTVTEIIPQKSLTDTNMQLTFTERDVIQPQMLPTVTVSSTNPVTTLREGTDYVLRYHNEDGPGITEVCAVGIGRYGGMLSRRIVTTETIEPDKAVSVSCTDGKTHCYRFVPPADGTYLLRLMPSASDYALLPEADDKDALFASVRLYRADLSEAELKNTISPLYESVCTLTADTPVYIAATAVSENISTLELEISPLGNKTHLLAVLKQQELPFTGDPEKDLPEIFCLPADSDSAAVKLIAGTDYQCTPLDPLMPGRVRLLLTGQGSYRGHALLEYRLQNPYGTKGREITFNEPFASGTGTQFFSFASSRIMQDPALVSADGTPFDAVFYPGGFRTANGIRITPGVPFRQENGGILAVRMQDGKSHALTLQAKKQYQLLADAEIEPASAVFTGLPIRPAFRVTYQGTELKEHEDYELDTNAVQQICGKFTVTLHGTGRFYGDASGVFTVAMPEKKELLLLDNGEADIPLDEKNQTALFRWIPQTDQCCLEKISLTDATVSLNTPDGRPTASASGTGRISKVFSVERGKTYYLNVTLPKNAPAGTVRVSLSDTLKSIVSCRIEGDSQLRIPDCTEPPALRIYDGSTLLEEGTDYTLLISETPMQPGSNLIYVRGAGIYTGETTFTYCCIPPFDDLPFDGTTSLLTVGEAYPVHRAEQDRLLPPGHAERLRFIAPEDGTYYLNLNNYDNNCCTMLLYNDKKEPLGSTQLCFRLKKDETLWLESVTKWPESGTDPMNTATITIQKEMPFVQFRDENYEYETEREGTCVITRMLKMQYGYTLPETVTDPETGITTDFREVFAALAAHGRTGDTFDGSVTFYGIPGGRAEHFCSTDDYCFCSLDPDCTIPGDLTGDYTVNEDDYLTLLRWMTEGSGMMLPGKAAEAADLNGDGMITMADLSALLALAAKT